MYYDVLNRPVVTASQGADGSLTAYFPTLGTATLYSLTGYDSRGNRASSIDPKLNTTIFDFDGASRLLETDQHLRTGGVGTNCDSSKCCAPPLQGPNEYRRKVIDIATTIIDSNPFKDDDPGEWSDAAKPDADDDAGGDRVPPPFPAPRAAARVHAHPPLRLPGQPGPEREPATVPGTAGAMSRRNP
jgi:hypothetical protein